MSAPRKPSPAKVAEWVAIIADEPALTKRYEFDRPTRVSVKREADRAREQLAKHGLDVNGQPKDKTEVAS